MPLRFQHCTEVRPSLLLNVLPTLLLIVLISCGAQTPAPAPPREAAQKTPADSRPLNANDPGQDITGWNGLPWGATPNEAYRLLAIFHPKQNSAEMSKLLIERFKIQEIEYEATLLFDVSGLNRVVLRPMSAREVPDFPLGLLKEGLQDKYGTPSQHEIRTEVASGFTVSEWVWQKPHGSATLRYRVPLGSRSPFIGLIYSKRTIIPGL